MISSEQLASALARLAARDRELLGFSLRRRVPDESLARLYDCEPQDVAQRRAAAIERLSDELDVQRGQDLGAVLQSLLEPEVWELAEEKAPSKPRLAAAAAAPTGEQETSPPPAPVTENGGGSDGAPDGDGKPVLEMLGQTPDPEEAGEVRRRRRIAWIVAGVLGLVGVAGIAALVGATVADEETPGTSSAESGGETRDQPRRFEPEGQVSLAAPFPSDTSAISCYPTATVRRSVVLRKRPGGSRKVKLTRRTEWGSPRVLGVVRRRKGWLAVQAPELKNGAVGWIRASQAKVNCVQWSLHADLSRRSLVVRKDGKAVRRLPIAIGSPNHPTPKGRFSVTDKLRVTDRSSPYGCCVLALTGHQNKLPADWPGGDRLAVHATTDTASIGKPVSLGCMRATPRQARWLIETVPLGSPIFVRS